MRTLQPVLCALGLHKRSRLQAHARHGVPHSRCRGCDRPMVKGPEGWRINERGEERRLPA
jgi:hypothetical protein